MSKQFKAQEALFKIGEILQIVDEQSDESGNLYPILSDEKITKLSKSLQNHPDVKHYALNKSESLLIGYAWYQLVSERKQFFDPIELLEKLYGSKSICIEKLPLITCLLKKNVFYTEKKRLIHRKDKSERLFSDDDTQVQYHQYSLLENDVYFHRTFLRILLEIPIQDCCASIHRLFRYSWHYYLPTRCSTIRQRQPREMHSKCRALVFV